MTRRVDPSSGDASTPSAGVDPSSLQAPDRAPPSSRSTHTDDAPEPSSFDDLVRAAEAGPPFLAVCRTSAAAREALRRLTSIAPSLRAWPGARVTTLAALIHPIDPPTDPNPALPDGHPWKASLDARPNLRASLGAHVERAHRLRAAGRDLFGLRPELRVLVDGGWGRPDLRAASEILAAAGSSSALPSTRIPLGFVAPPMTFGGTQTPLESALLAALGCRVDALPDLDGLEIEARVVPDVSAEARAVAAELADQPNEALVLTPDFATAERIRAALSRNGVAVATDDPGDSARRSLGVTLTAIAPLFEARGDASLAADDLVRVLVDPMLAPGSPSRARTLVAATGHARASLADWLARFERIEARARADHDGPHRHDEDRVESDRRLRSVVETTRRVRALAACARGGRIDDLAALIEAIVPGEALDPLARAALGALRAVGARRCDRETVASILGAAFASGRIDRGVRILGYLEYDGRACERLVLTGVHDHGLSRPPEPDPFLTESDRQALALPSPLRAVEERLELARWATSRARRAVALVTIHDASGRRVSPPPLLRLRVDERHAGAAHGLAFPLPEGDDRAAFVPSSGASTPGDPIAIQIDVEWARAGARFIDSPPVHAPPPPDHATLEDHLRRDPARHPAALTPWLGRIDSAAAPIPDGFVFSATRLRAFTQCLYRAFLETTLRIRPVDEPTEDLDRRGEGIAIHAVLEQALPGARLDPTGVGVEPGREASVERLARLESLAAAAVAGEARGEGEAAILGRLGLARRWARQLERWLEARVVAAASDPDALEVVACEHAFGPLSLPLDASAIPLRGFVDLVLVRRDRDGAARAWIVDFKTGGRVATEDDLRSLREPQLLVYALGLECGGPIGKDAAPALDGPPRVERVVLEYVRRGGVVALAVTDELRLRARRTLGALLRRAGAGELPLAPHPAACPLFGRGSCDYRDICRLRRESGADREGSP